MFNSSFTFAASRSSSSSSNTLATPDHSPCSSPAPQFNISDLADRFADQRIQRRAQICYDSCQAYANDTSSDDDELNWLIPPLDECSSAALLRRTQTCPTTTATSSSSSSSSFTPPQRSQSPPRRTQRQANARLLCSAAHREEIAVLMARMVEAQEQCLVASSSSSPPISPVLQEDEGYKSGDDPLMETVSRSSSITVQPTRFDRRRASDLVAGGACVSKSIRIRKSRHLRRVTTSEMAEKF